MGGGRGHVCIHRTSALEDQVYRVPSLYDGCSFLGGDEPQETDSAQMNEQPIGVYIRTIIIIITRPL